MNLAKTQANIINNGDIFCHKFKNNGNSGLSVNGSNTPAVFTLEDITADEFLVTHISFVLSSGTILDLTNFAGLPSLQNGIDFALDGTVVFKNNADVLLFMTNSNIDTAKITGAEHSIIAGSCIPLISFKTP